MAYEIISDGEIEVRADWAQASSPIQVRMVGDEAWRSTVYQVAGVGRDNACRVVSEWLDQQS